MIFSTFSLFTECINIINIVINIPTTCFKQIFKQILNFG